MSIEQNKAVVRRFMEEVLDKQDYALVDELLAPDYVNHLAPGGREGFKQFNTMLRSALPDLKIHMSTEHLVAEGDYVVARITFHVANAGKEATGSELSEYRLANGKIVEDWPPSSIAGLLQQVGVTLPSGPGGM
jgi:predicted SnoaL-like aldol condensation-catalyzing enzyme